MIREFGHIIHVLAAVQLSLLVVAIVLLLLDDASNVLAVLVISPFVLLSLLLLIGLVVFLIVHRQYRYLLGLIGANLVTLCIGAVSIFFTSRFYSDYMLRSQCDTTHYELIPPRVVLPDSIILDSVWVIHHIQLCRKHLFSNEYELVDDDTWNDCNNGWYDYYTLQLRQDTAKSCDALLAARDITGIDFEIIGVNRDSVSWSGNVGLDQQFSFLHHKVPGDTIRLKYSSASGTSDTIMVVKSMK